MVEDLMEPLVTLQVTPQGLWDHWSQALYSQPCTCKVRSVTFPSAQMVELSLARMKLLKLRMLQSCYLPVGRMRQRHSETLLMSMGCSSLWGRPTSGMDTEPT